MPHQFDAFAYAAIRVQDPAAIAQLRAGAIATYKPVNDQELEACERLAMAQGERQRCGMIDAGFHNAFMNECLRPGGLPHNLVEPELARDTEVMYAQNRSLALATGFDRICRESDTFKTYLRYRADCRRELREARDDLHSLIRMRKQFASDSGFEIPEPLMSEPMPPPPAEARPDELMSAYDPTIPIVTPVPRTIRPKQPKAKRGSATRPYSEEEPRFAGYPKGDEVPQPIRTYGRNQARQPTE